MTSTLMSQDCGAACKEEAEFSVKFVIKSLTVTDAERSSGYTDVLIVISFDGNVIKIADIEENDEGEMKPLGRTLDLQLSPEKFSEKLRRCPIMFELSRECSELGTVKLEVSDCFLDAVKCEEFYSESLACDLKFITGSAENALMSLIFVVSRVAEDPVMHSMHQNSKLKVKKMPKSKRTKKVLRSDKSSSNFDKLSSSFEDNSDMSLTDDTDLCPCDEQSEERGPSTSSRSKSTRSRCCSDIAPSINIQDFCDSNNKRTTCIGCGGFSISGVTCDNKALLGLHSNSDCSAPRGAISPSPSDLSSSEVEPLYVKTPCKSRSPNPCKSASKRSTIRTSKARICSECFADLSVLPKGKSCPKCTARAQQELKLISFKGHNVKHNENHKIRGCIKSIFEEIFLETKERLMDDWQRLNRGSKKKPKRACKKNVRARNPSGIKSMPRCSKLLRAQGQFLHIKTAGLRKKHPGVLVGHHHCQPNGSLVPKNMGWLWNVGVSRKGWKPGAVDKTVAKIMMSHLTPPPESAPCPVKKEAPTLRVKRKNGEYTIVMNPLLDELDDPSPIVFQISKTDDAKKRAVARNLLKLKGFKKKCDCCCIDKCACMNVCKKAQLKYELYKVSCDLELEHKMTFGDLNESGESEIDFEYTPPYAVKSKNPCVKPCKPVKVSVAETQYELQAVENPVEDKEGSSEKEKKDDKEKKKKEVPKVEVTKKKKQIVKMMRDIPTKCVKVCAMPCDNIYDAGENHRFTTNYNPIYVQCPPQPPPCVNRSHMTHGIHHNPFWC